MPRTDQRADVGADEPAIAKRGRRGFGRIEIAVDHASGAHGDHAIAAIGHRLDDLLNLGGLKIPASAVEAQLRGLPAVGDCAAIATMLQGGAVTLGLALVLAEGYTLEQAAPQVQAALNLGPGTSARLLPMAQLPRLINGKLDRVALQRAFRENG